MTEQQTKELNEYKKMVKLNIVLMLLGLAGTIGAIVMAVIAVKNKAEINMATPVFVIACVLLMISGLKQASDNQRKVNEIIIKNSEEYRAISDSKYQADRKKKKKKQ